MREPIFQGGSIDLSDQHRAEFTIFDRIDGLLKKKLGRSGGPKFIQALYRDILLQIVAHAVRNGTFRLPGGLGSFRLSRLRRSSTGPKGARIPAPAKAKLRYFEGDSLVIALGRKVRKGPGQRPPRIVKLVEEFGQEQVAAVASLTLADLEQLMKEIE